MRSMRRTEAEVQVERLVRGDLLGVGDELDRLTGQVRGQVIALFRGGGRLGLVVVVDKVGIPLTGVSLFNWLCKRGPVIPVRQV